MKTHENTQYVEQKDSLHVYFKRQVRRRRTGRLRHCKTNSCTLSNLPCIYMQCFCAKTITWYQSSSIILLDEALALRLYR